MNIGGKIKKLRDLNGLTQQQLADLIGKSINSVKKYESNYTVPPSNVIEKISKKLNVPISTLLDDEAYDTYINSRLKYIEQVNCSVNNMSSKIINDDPHLIVQFSEEYRNKRRENEELSQKYFSTLIEHETSKVQSMESFFKLILSWSPWDDLDELNIEDIDELVDSLTLMYNFKMYEFSQRNKNEDI